MRAWGTRSSMIWRCSPVRFAIQAWCFVTGGPAGMSPKYFSTFWRAVSASMSPASTMTALAAP